MELKDILSISGKPGLYKLLSTGNSSIIVESLIDGRRMPTHAAGKISSLEDISIYTYEEDVPLSEVFGKIYAKENGGEAINHNSKPEELKAYMLEVMPDYDEDRVYASDLKKLFQWYNLLLNSDGFKMEASDDSADTATEEKIEDESES